jgi:hypothetical protein
MEEQTNKLKHKFQINIYKINTETNEKQLIHSQEAHTLVRNFFDVLVGMLINQARSVKDLNGNVYTIDFSIDFNKSGLIGICGTSSNAENFEDYTLENYITSFETIGPEVINVTQGYAIKVTFNFSFNRRMEINEVGIFKTFKEVNGNLINVLIVRNVLSTSIDIKPGLYLSVEYYLEFTT